MPVISSNLPINEDKGAKWDAGGATARVKEWASDSAGNIDFKKYRKAFFWVAANGGDKQSDYKLGFADIIDGSPRATFRGVSAAMAVLNSGRGGADIGNEREAVYTQAKKLYAKFGEKAPELKAMTQTIERKQGERVNIICSIEPNSVKDLGSGVFEAIITTSSLDRQGESIDTSGITTDNYMNNPVVLYGHDYEGLPIGKTTKLTQFKNKMKAVFQLAVEEYPFAATIAALLKGGYLSATSIGGLVKQWSDDYKTIMEMEMVEFSIVPVPANPEALITSRNLQEVTGKSIDQIRNEFLDFSKSVLLDKVADMGEDEVNQAIKVLKKLIATLEESAKANSTVRGAERNEVKRIKYITLRDSAKAVATQSQRVITTIKLKSQE